MLRHARLASLLSLALTACGSENDLSPTEFASMYPEAYCSYVKRCCAFAQQSYTSTGTCQQATSDALTQLLAFRDSSTPHATFDGAQGRTCVNRLKSAKCTEDPKLIEGCAPEAVTPQQQVGDECTYSSECLSAYCIQAQKNTKGSCGTGGSSGCSGDDRACSAGSYCGSGNLCLPRLENSKPCSAASQCQSGICSPTDKICVARSEPYCAGG